MLSDLGIKNVIKSVYANFCGVHGGASFELLCFVPPRGVKCIVLPCVCRRGTGELCVGGVDSCVAAPSAGCLCSVSSGRLV